MENTLQSWSVLFCTLIVGVDSEKPTTDSSTTVTSSDSKVDTLNGEVPTDNPQQIIDNDKVSEL